MTHPLLPPSIIGMIGGGQLGMMAIREAQRMGYGSVVWDPDARCPASKLADEVITAPFGDPAAAERLASLADVITYEFEHISVELVRSLGMKKRLRPGHEVLQISQNRVLEKRALDRLGIPVARFDVGASVAEFRTAVATVGFPVVVKTANAGYDGKGQMILRESADLESFVRGFSEAPQEIVVEEFLDLECEVSVIAVRNDAGAVREFPVAQNEHRDHILHLTVVPATVSDAVCAEALLLARKVIEGLAVVGVLCVEMFVTKSGNVLVNEIAPRPHNSGHFSLDACSISQFEAAVRVVTGLEIPEPRLLTPCAMVNVLGKHLSRLDIAKLHALPGIKLHLYGKKRIEPRRKMGHITILGDTPDRVMSAVEEVRSLIGEPN